MPRHAERSASVPLRRRQTAARPCRRRRRELRQRRVNLGELFRVGRLADGLRATPTISRLRRPSGNRVSVRRVPNGLRPLKWRRTNASLTRQHGDALKRVALVEAAPAHDGQVERLEVLRIGRRELRRRSFALARVAGRRPPRRPAPQFALAVREARRPADAPHLRAAHSRRALPIRRTEPPLRGVG